MRGIENSSMKRLGLWIALLFLGVSSVSAQAPMPLTLQRTMVLSGITGKFDHFAIDETGNRLFAAAEGNQAVAIVNLGTGQLIQSLSGLRKPHGLAWVPATQSLYVSDGALAELRVYKGSPLALAGTIKLSEDADDMVFDNASHLLFVGHGGTDSANPARIAIVETDSFSLVANVPVATHPEGLAADSKGGRIFTNLADLSEVAVIGTARKSIEGKWKLSKAAQNVPIAFDSEHQAVFVACRNPGSLIMLDATTGKEIASQPAGGKADDLFYDAELHRIYLISGAGEVDTYQVDSGKTLHSLEVLHTALGARTALFVPSHNLLYLGVPATADHPGEILVYSTPRSGAAQ
jgi:DNA-binding beta-propeller fold protein YncE